MININQTPYPMISFSSPESINQALDEKKVADMVEANSKRFHIINVAEAMQNLTQVGDLLQLAYAGSQGFANTCHQKIGEILLDYQPLIKDSVITSMQFVNGCLSALKLHSSALTLANKNKLELALKQLQNCGTLAEAMAKASIVLLEKSVVLSNQSKEALILAMKDKNASYEQNQTVQKILAEIEETEAQLREKTKLLHEAIEKECQIEEKALEEARDARNKACLISIGMAIVSMQGGPIQPVMAMGNLTNGIMNEIQGATRVIMDQVGEAVRQKQVVIDSLNESKKQLAVKQVQYENAKEEEKNIISQDIAVLQSEIESKGTILEEKKQLLDKAEEHMKKEAEISQNRANEAAKRRAGLQQAKIEANADLAKSVCKLKHANEEKNNLGQAIVALELTIKTMGKVRTIFENTRVFWECVKKHCDHLSNIEQVAVWVEADCPDEFIEEVKMSGLSWLALGKINLLAYESIEKVDKNMDHIMNNLPTESEAIKLVRELSDSISAQIENENASLSSEEKKQDK